MSEHDHVEPGEQGADGRQPVEDAPDQWRSLDELGNTEEFQRFLHGEFPGAADSLLTPVSRRDILRLAGASIALASVAACARQPAEKIVPYVRAPEEFVPGQPLYFATAMSMGGYAKGVLVESHLGRPTKVEGNPDHPASLGATDIFAQASTLTLYDPDRSQTVTHTGQISNWSAFLAAVKNATEAQRIKGGTGLRILTERITSPTLAAQLRSLLEQFPGAKWHQYDTVTHDNARAGARLAFGRDVDVRLDVSRADAIVSLDADFLGVGPASLAHTRQFSDRRQPAGPGGMNRLYVVEGMPSITGSMADHRLRAASRSIESMAFQLAERLAGAGRTGEAGFMDAVADDLLQHRGRSIVLAGYAQPARVHALAHIMNDALGNVGRTVDYIEPVEAAPVDEMQSLRELAADMERGLVDVLVIVGGNPVYAAPHDVEFAKHMARVPLRVHLSLYEDETSALCHWHVPEAHYLEAWGDARAFDGTTSIVQPLIAPLHGGKSAYELLAALGSRGNGRGEGGDAGRADVTGYTIVQNYWRRQLTTGVFDSQWEKALNDGVVEGTASPVVQVSLRTSLGALRPESAAPSGTEIVFRPDPTVWDGRFANNAWLQELPKPLTKLTWDNAAFVSPAMASRLNLTNGNVVELRYRNAAVHAPVWILPGHADDSVTVTLGYGRTAGGRTGEALGFNANAIRTSDAPWFGGPLEIVKTGRQYNLVSTQHHFSMEGRGFVQAATVAEFERNPSFAKPPEGGPAPDETLYPGYKYEGHAWGLAVDLNTCTGCSACVTACQAENNIPVVGKAEVARGREMHWIRIDRYYEGSPDTPSIYQQPVMCMQCENAPCELVCPVGATTHSDEGINQMVYNRCVGTRYCSNNCPYKVRRFNFFQYADWDTPSLKGLRNPDVTVRSRGVMEKCTYCVQRINNAKIQAEVDGRPLRDGEIKTACQAVCPAQAITFGDINDPEGRVAKLKAEPRNYGLLVDLNTRPRTTYLARLTNPNPDLEPLPEPNPEPNSGPQSDGR